MAPDSVAMALAIRVLPVPGGPYSSTPLGTRAPSFLNRLGSRRNSTISSSSSRASSAPATSFQRTEWPLAGWILFGLVVGMARHILYAKKTRAMKQAGSTNGQSSNSSHVPKP